MKSLLATLAVLGVLSIGIARAAEYELEFDATDGVGPSGTGSFLWDWSEYRMTDLQWDFGGGQTGGLTESVLEPFLGGDLLFGYFLATRDHINSGTGATVEGGMGWIAGPYPGDAPGTTIGFCRGTFNSFGCGMPNGNDSTYAFRAPDGAFIARGVVRSTPVCGPPATFADFSGFASVHNVQLDGRTYDVYFVDTDFSGALSQIAFDNADDARRASQALEAAIVDGANGDFDTDPMLNRGCENSSACEILTPWSYDAVSDVVEADVVVNQPGFVDDFATATVDADSDLGFDPARVWARWAPTPPNDCDEDTVPSDEDNCLLAANTSQLDTDRDNIGNSCDADIAPDVNDCSVNFLDLNVMKSAFFSNPGSANWNANADLNGDEMVNFADLNTMKSGFFSTPGPTALKNFCEPCAWMPAGPPSFYQLDAQFSPLLSERFLPTGDPDTFRVVFRTLAGPIFGFKVLNTASGFECDTPPSLLELGRTNDYACGIPDGSPAIPIEIPEPGCYALDLFPLGILDIRLGHRDFNSL